MRSGGIAALLALALSTGSALAQVEAEAAAGSESASRSHRHSLVGATDVSWLLANSKFSSWLYNGSGKLRYDEDHDGLRVNRIFLDYRGRISSTLSGRVVVNMNNDVSEKVDVTDAYLEWRPVPRSAWRFRAKLGAFYPRLSFENVDPGWSSPYALSSSVLNTWIGEELRTIGGELRVIRDLPWGTDQQLSLEGAVFYANDPTGAALTWRGWAAHDRQTGLSGSIPMPANSVIYPWAAGGEPLPNYEPFEEIDNRAGFYLGAQWRLGERALVKVFHYDNRGDPEATSGPEYAWDTSFNHIGAQFALPLGVGFLGQWIDGTTSMGPDLGPWRVQDVEFDSSFALLTRGFGKQRLTLRYEWFDLQPYNDPPGITNQDKGNAIALAWLYQFRPKLRLGAEYLQIRSDHCKQDSCLWTMAPPVGYGLPQNIKESQVQLSVRWQFAGPS